MPTQERPRPGTAPVVPRTAPRTLTGEECFLLLQKLASKGPPEVNWRKAMRNRLIALIMLDTGLRVGELVQLFISDLYIEQSPVQTLFVRAEIAKNKHERTIPLSTRLTTDLFDYAEEWLNWECYSPNNFIFMTSSHAEHLTPRTIQHIIKSAGKAALGRRVTPHMLRHTFATRLMQRTNIRVVQELLGHRNVSSTQIYTHVNEQDKKDAIKKLLYGVDGEGELT